MDYQVILDSFSIILMDVLMQDVPHLDINKPWEGGIVKDFVQSGHKNFDHNTQLAWIQLTYWITKTQKCS